MDKKLIFRDFLRYAGLSVLGMLGVSCYILADTYFIAQGLGTDGLAALNLIIPLFSLLLGAASLIGVGAGMRYAVADARGKREEADQAFSQGLGLLLCFAFIYFLSGAFVSGPLMRLLGGTGEVFVMGEVYLRLMLLCAPFFMLNNYLSCFIRNDGFPQYAMAATIAGSLSNVLLDYLFIFPLQMGMTGAVLATCLAPVISLCIMLPLLVKKKHKFRLRRLKPVKGLLPAIFKGGLPSLVAELSSGLTVMIFNFLILAARGDIGVAAYSVIANISIVVMAVFSGIGQGIQPLLSRHYGTGRRKEGLVTFRYALAAVLLIAGSVYAGLFLEAGPVVRLFNAEGNRQLQELAETGIRIYFSAVPFAGFNIIAATYFSTHENVKAAHFVSLLRGVIIIVPMAFLLAKAAGMTGIWWVFPLTEFSVALLALQLFLKMKRTVPGGSGREAWNA